MSVYHKKVFNELKILVSLTIHEIEKRYPDRSSLSGLCDEMSVIFIELFNEYIKKSDSIINPEDVISCIKIHGELAHSGSIPSKYWTIEHTIVLIKLRKRGLVWNIYVDTSLKQFVDILGDQYGSLYYISDKKPKYMLLDRDNPLWNKTLIRWINDHIRIGSLIKIGICTYLEYIIRGSISDFCNKK